jgi:hypothetical protein
VYLVGDYEAVVREAEFSEALEFFPCPYAAYGIVRAAA